MNKSFFAGAIITLFSLSAHAQDKVRYDIQGIYPQMPKIEVIEKLKEIDPSFTVVEGESGDFATITASKNGSENDDRVIKVHLYDGKVASISYKQIFEQERQPDWVVVKKLLEEKYGKEQGSSGRDSDTMIWQYQVDPEPYCSVPKINDITFLAPPIGTYKEGCGYTIIARYDGHSGLVQKLNTTLHDEEWLLDAILKNKKAEKEALDKKRNENSANDVKL